MIFRTFVDTRGTEPAIAAKSLEYSLSIRVTFASEFDAAKQAGELADDVDVARLARRFQSYVNMLRIELHQGSARNEVAELAEDFAQSLESMRLAPS